MKRMLVFTLGMVFLLSTAGFAMHHDGGMQGGGVQHGNKWWQKPAVAEMINLSVEEAGKISDQWVQHRRKMIKLKGNLHAEKFELEVLDDREEVDASTLGQQFEKVQKARADIDAERFNYRMEIRSLLGPERFSKIDSHFPLYGKDHMKDGQGMQGMHGGKGMMGMGSGKRQMHSMHGRGAKSGCPMMGAPQGHEEAESSSDSSDSQ